MSKYNEQYYFIRRLKDNDAIPFLTPDENTAGRHYDYKAQPVGSAPLVFHNGFKERSLKKGIVGLVPDILFAGSDMVVKSAIRQKLLLVDIPRLHMHSAIYIDDKDNWHEDYWYLTFTDPFDCWDRETSEYDDEDDGDDDDDPSYEVYRFSLNTDLLDKTPLRDRLLFKMGGQTSEFAVCHESILSIFRASGAKIIPIRDYGSQ